VKEGGELRSQLDSLIEKATADKKERGDEPIIAGIVARQRLWGSECECEGYCYLFYSFY
jgi:hypothetical protein